MTLYNRRSALALIGLPLALPSSAFAQANASGPAKTIHVLVALCDNVNQGIVPVPAHLGNGEDPARNLYWGAAFGVKTFFKRSTDWQLITEIKSPTAAIVERIVFRKTNSNVWLVADAYRGAEIRRATEDTLNFAAGINPQIIAVEEQNRTISLKIGGAANLIAYIGHDGLMDFSLPAYPQRTNDAQRDIVILACASRQYFSGAIRAGGARPLALTTGLMAPEAYTLKAIADGWATDSSPADIRAKAAEAYAKYQKINLSAAKRLFSD